MNLKIILYLFLPSILFLPSLHSQDSQQSNTGIFESSEHIDPAKETLDNSTQQDSSNKDSSNKDSDAKNTPQDNPGLFESSEHINPEKKKDGDKDKKKESPHKITGGVTFISDYRSRGLSQTMCRPAVQGELTYTHKSGFYFKNWASNVSGAESFLNVASLEWDIYLGITHKVLNSEITYDVGFQYYYYPGARAPVPQKILYDTVEYYLAFSYKDFNIRLSETITDFFAVNSANPPRNWTTNRLVRPNGHSLQSPYIEMNYVWSPFSKFTSTFHVGYQGVTNYPQLSYFDWQITVVYQFSWFDVNLAYVDTTGRRAFYTLPDATYRPRKVYIGRTGLVFGVSKAF